MYLSNQRTHLNNLAGMICNVDYGGVVIKKYKEMKDCLTEMHGVKKGK